MAGLGQTTQPQLAQRALPGKGHFPSPGFPLSSGEGACPELPPVQAAELGMVSPELLVPGTSADAADALRDYCSRRTLPEVKYELRDSLTPVGGDALLNPHTLARGWMQSLEQRAT